MIQNKKILHSVWNRSADIITKKNVTVEGIDIDAFVAGLFCPGPTYYYMVDFYDRQIKYMSPAIEQVLGLSATASFDDIIAQIHPDDINYVAGAERTVLNYLYTSIGRDKVREYKMSYCFRFKIADGSYALFQHQAIILTTDEQGGFARSLNIHTNINHLTTANNYKTTLAQITGAQHYVHLDVATPQNDPPRLPFIFSKRETEIIRLITSGLKNQQIAERLSISLHTVKNHRKNIMQKAGAKSSSQLVARCITEGLI